VLFEGFLLNKVSFESDTSMKDPCITREQSLGLHDVVNDQGSAIWKFSDMRESIQQSKSTD